MNTKEFKCNICIKFYTSYKSLWNHSNKFHKKETTDNNTVSHPEVSLNVPKSQSDVSIKIFNCKYCNNIYKHKQSKFKHEQKCENKKNNDQYSDLKKEIEDLKNQLATIINKNAKIHPKTLHKINNQLINNNTINNNTNNTINNTIINNTYVKFGSVAHSSVLSESKILSILNKPYKSIEESIKLIHFNKKLPEYNNIMITNMKDNIAYTYNGKKFISVNKDELIDELIENHKDQIEISYDEYKDKIREFTQKRLQAFFNDINNESDIFKDSLKKSHKHFKAYKMQDIKMLIYNLSDSKKLEALKNMDLKEKII